MNNQLTLPLTTADKRTAEEMHRDHWRICWHWDGPQAGGLCEINSITVQRADGGGQMFAYMEQCKLVAQQDNGRWLAEICMPDPAWRKNGIMVDLGILDIWPPTHSIRKAAATGGNNEQ